MRKDHLSAALLLFGCDDRGQQGLPPPGGPRRTRDGGAVQNREGQRHEGGEDERGSGSPERVPLEGALARGGGRARHQGFARWHDHAGCRAAGRERRERKTFSEWRTSAGGCNLRVFSFLGTSCTEGVNRQLRRRPPDTETRQRNWMASPSLRPPRSVRHRPTALSRSAPRQCRFKASPSTRFSSPTALPLPR